MRQKRTCSGYLTPPKDGLLIVFFDEADALFGRRSEVKDSHDRHVNNEVSYLFQHLETYLGTCILSTNMRECIDETFLHHILLIVFNPFASGDG